MKHRSQHLKNIFTVMKITFFVVFFSIAFQMTAKANQSIVGAGRYHTVGLKTDGSVVAVGDNDWGQCDVSPWADIVQVDAGKWYYTVGLKTDGTVVAVGRNGDGQCNVSSWMNILQISAGSYHTVGLTSDGTVVAVGNNSNGQCNVSTWTNIVQLAAGGYHTIGLKSDGTVVAVGRSVDGQLNVNSWTDIVQVSAGAYHTLGLKSDGTVVAVGDNSKSQSDVNSWTDIVQVSAGYVHTVGLKSDGTVLAVGWNDNGQCNVSTWTNILHLDAGVYHTVGLKTDGSVVAVGDNDYAQCDVFDWDLFENQHPLADAGDDQVVFDEVTLDGSGSYDTDGTIVSFDWMLQHRGNLAFDRTAAGVNPTVSSLEPGFYDVTLTVTDDVGLTGTDTMLLAVAGSCDCVGSTMHIQSIIAGTAPASKNWKYGQVAVTIFDDCGNPVSGASVTGTFTGDYDQTITGSTGSDGTAVITTSSSAKKPSYTFCVDLDGVSHGTLAYEPNDNIEDCKSK